MKWIGPIVVAILVLGCATPRPETPLPEPTTSRSHPIADGVNGTVVLRDGRSATGYIRWREATQEYMVIGRSLHLIFPAGRVDTIEITPDVEQSVGGDSGKAAADGVPTGAPQR